MSAISAREAGGAGLSVAIVCQDEAQTLPYTLYCIYRVLSPHLSDVVIVDGGSLDNTLDVIEAWMGKLPIVLLHREYDTAGEQKNFALQRCSGKWTLALDADMTFGANLGDVYGSGFFDGHEVWDFDLYFTVGDEHHYCPKNGLPDGPVGPTTRLFLSHRRYLHDFHEQVFTGGENKGFCESVPFFENSWLQTRSALRHRGERWQPHAGPMLARGIGPGPPDRYVVNENHARHIYKALPQGVMDLVILRSGIPCIAALDEYRQREWPGTDSALPPIELWDKGYGF